MHTKKCIQTQSRSLQRSFKYQHIAWERINWQLDRMII